MLTPILRLCRRRYWLLLKLKSRILALFRKFATIFKSGVQCARRSRRLSSTRSVFRGARNSTRFLNSSSRCSFVGEGARRRTVPKFSGNLLELKKSPRKKLRKRKKSKRKRETARFQGKGLKQSSIL